MFDATLRDRELSFQSAPGTTMFLHWLVGMVYVFYFASFILLLREVRPAGEVAPGRPRPRGRCGLLTASFSLLLRSERE